MARLMVNERVCGTVNVTVKKHKQVSNTTADSRTGPAGEYPAIRPQNGSEMIWV